MMDDLERLLNYVNKKNKDGILIINPKEVMKYYQLVKIENPQKSFIKTVNFIDNYFKNGTI